MMVADERQRKMLDDLENEILSYAALLPPAETMDDLRRELEHYGFDLGSA